MPNGYLWKKMDATCKARIYSLNAGIHVSGKWMYGKENGGGARRINDYYSMMSLCLHLRGCVTSWVAIVHCGCDIGTNHVIMYFTKTLNQKDVR